MANLLQTSNYVQLTINAAVDTVQTTIDLVSAAGLPALGPSEYTIVTLERIIDNFKEIVRVDDITGNTLTVVRAQEGTVPLTFSAGDACRNYLTSGMFQEALDGSGVPAATESVSGIQRVATEAEADALSLDGITLSPQKFPAAFNSLFNGFSANGRHQQLDADANNITQNGVYNMNADAAATSNLPTLTGWYFVEHNTHVNATTHGFQVAKGMSGAESGGRMFFRNKDTTWGSWIEVGVSRLFEHVNRKQAYATLVGAGATAAVTPVNYNGATITAAVSKGLITFLFNDAFPNVDYSFSGGVFEEGGSSRTYSVVSKLVGSFTIQVTGTAAGDNQWPDAVDFAFTKNVPV